MRACRVCPVVFAAALLAVTSGGRADVKLPAIFGDHMVVQINKPVVVWGWADPGEKVTVTFAGSSGGATADAAGKWSVKLPMVTHPDAPQTMTVAGKNKITLTDVLLGEVWVCSGQSNMEFALSSGNDAAKEIAAANYPQVRLITVPRNPQPGTQDDFKGSWTPCTPQSAKSFTAVGYFFGREIHQVTKLPVGLIHTSYGGTPAEAWTSREALDAVPALKPMTEAFDATVKSYDPAKAKAAYDAAMVKWKQAAEKAKADKKPAPRPPSLSDPVHSPHSPTTLFNGMLNPIVPFAIRGAIWYQGESNASRAYQYRTLFPTMIKDWRTRWGEGDFPFYFVQLANFKAVKPDPADSDWAELREAQSMTLKALPNTGQAVIIDIGDAGNIHPTNKQDVGKRLARWALVKDYGKTDVVIAGPMFKSVKISGNKAVLTFENADGLKTSDGGAVKGFAVAGADKKFVWADAKITGSTIEVSSPAVAKIAAVRYGWADNPIVNLYNGAGLPASPFRTDTWPGVTEKN